MKIQMWDAARVIPYEKNPRRNEDAVEEVAASIKEFGSKQPIVVDKDAVIIVGHTGLLAALRLGMKEIPVLVAGVRRFYVPEGKWNLLGDNWPEGASRLTGGSGWLRGPATPRKRHSLILPYRFELTRDAAA